MAKAFLYNVTGISAYEEVINSESVCAPGRTSPIQYFYSGEDGINQLYATAAYLITPQPVHYSTLYNNMKSRIISEVKNNEADLMNTRPSRRTTYNPPSYWRTAHFVGRTIVAHAVTDSQIDENYFRKALDPEAMKIFSTRLVSERRIITWNQTFSFPQVRYCVESVQQWVVIP